jgi:integrase
VEDTGATATEKRIGLRQVRALKPGGLIWDASLPGFGARRQRSTAVSYVLFYRTKEGRQRWFTIGRHGAPWTPESARDDARRLLGRVASKADPAAEKRAARNAQTVAELCDLYLADAEAGRLVTRRRNQKKASTIALDRGRVARHIKPLLGRLRVASVTRQDIEVFMHDVAEGKTAATSKTKARGLARVRGGKGAANRTVGLLGAIFTYAVRHRMRSDNPVQGVVRPADGRRDRRLTDAEYLSLGNALTNADLKGIWPAAIAAARFLAITGWRSGEALALQWEEIDIPRRTATLGETKTGRSMRPLSETAIDILRSLTPSGQLVFPATRGSGDVIMSGFKKLWKRIAKLGDLPSDVTPHVLRHSFASLAADLGYSEPVIAALVGHQGRSTTSRYLHSADAVLLAAADAVADRTLELMGEKMPKGEDRRASTIGTLISSRPGHVSNSLRATSFFR